jgi:hypothetical protein
VCLYGHMILQYYVYWMKSDDFFWEKMSKVKVKPSHYRSWQVVRVRGCWSSQILRQSAHEGGKVVSSTHRPPLTQEIFLIIISVRGWGDPRPPLTQEIFLIIISVRGWGDPRAIVRPEGLCKWKIRMTHSGIDPATFLFVAQCLNHCATAYPWQNMSILLNERKKKY